jgi:hypothetical protein
MYQLHKKGYESIAEAAAKGISINVNGAKIKDVKVEGPKGEPGTSGKDGKTPIKGVDYFTRSEILEIIDDILSKIPVPKNGKDGVVDYNRVLEFVKKEVSKIKIPKPKDGQDAVVDYSSIINSVLKQIPKPKEAVVDYDAIKKHIEDSIEKTRVNTRQLNSGGPTTRLGELVDVNIDGATLGQALVFDGKNWVPGSGGIDPDDILQVAGLDIGTSTHTPVAGEAYFEDTNIVVVNGTITAPTINGIEINATDFQSDLYKDSAGNVLMSPSGDVSNSPKLSNRPMIDEIQDSDGVLSIDVYKSQLNDWDNELSVDWNSRILYNDDGAVEMMDWNTAGSIDFKANTLKTTGNIELGHETDTTLSRSGAGVLAVEGVNVVTTSSTDTLTNKTIDGANNTITNTTGYEILTYGSGSSTTAMVASTTYYFGNQATQFFPITGATTNRIYIHKTGTIKKVNMAFRTGSGTPSSAETVSMYIRVNNTTDYTLLTSLRTDVANTVYFNQITLSVPVTAGDYINIKMVTPAWSVVANFPFVELRMYIE